MLMHNTFLNVLKCHQIYLTVPPPPITKGGGELLSKFSLRITRKLVELSANQNAASSETEKVLIGNSCYT